MDRGWDLGIHQFSPSLLTTGNFLWNAKGSLLGLVVLFLFNPTVNNWPRLEMLLDKLSLMWCQVCSQFSCWNSRPRSIVHFMKNQAQTYQKFLKCLLVIFDHVIFDMSLNYFNLLIIYKEKLQKKTIILLVDSWNYLIRM